MKSESEVTLLATPWTAAYQAPPSMGFSRQECWSGVPSLSPTNRYKTANESHKEMHFTSIKVTTITPFCGASDMGGCLRMERNISFPTLAARSSLKWTMNEKLRVFQDKHTATEAAAAALGEE